MPKTYHCWRCKMPIPMLTDEEWEEIYPLIRFDIEHLKTYRAVTGATLKEAINAVQYQSFDRYFEMTCFRETNINALEHHQLSQYGDECRSCGYLLRTPKASFCANCGMKKSSQPIVFVRRELK
jgi:rubrerythrin